MHTYHGQAYNDDEDEWFRMQVKTTMNIDCPVWMDWFHGGLQFQIEHHLWPKLPRHNLRQVRTILREFAKLHKLEYHEATFFGCIQIMFRRLKATAQQTKSF